jgi:hypothetical protein
LKSFPNFYTISFGSSFSKTLSSSICSPSSSIFRTQMGSSTTGKYEFIGLLLLGGSGFGCASGFIYFSTFGVLSCMGI